VLKICLSHILVFTCIFHTKVTKNTAKLLAFVVVPANRSSKKKTLKLSSTKNKNKCTRRRYKHISEWRQASVSVMIRVYFIDGLLAIVSVTCQIMQIYFSKSKCLKS